MFAKKKKYRSSGLLPKKIIPSNLTSRYYPCIQRASKKADYFFIW